MALVFSRWRHLSSPLSVPPPAAGRANFSWSFVMVTWRCCGYITSNVCACSPAQSCCVSLREKVRAWCTAAVFLLWRVSSFNALLTDTLTADRLSGESLELQRQAATFLWGIMRNVQLWFLPPIDSWQGERDVFLLLPTCFNGAWSFMQGSLNFICVKTLYSMQCLLKQAFGCAVIAPVLNSSWQSCLSCQRRNNVK